METMLAELNNSSKLPEIVIEIITNGVYEFNNTYTLPFTQEAEETETGNKNQYQLFRDNLETGVEDEDFFLDMTSVAAKIQPSNYNYNKAKLDQVRELLFSRFEKVRRAESKVSPQEFLQAKEFVNGKISEQKYYMPIMQKAIKQRERFLPDNVDFFLNDFVSEKADVDKLVRKYFDIDLYDYYN